MRRAIVLTAAAFAVLTSCQRQESQSLSGADSIRAVNETLAYRRMTEEYFRRDPSSPFNTTPPVPYEGLRWFPPDVRYYFTSRLHLYEKPETVIVMGTKGEPRKQLRYGWFSITLDGTEYRLNVYKFTAEDLGQRPALAKNLSVWFTDETTGKETYHVGRYIEIEPESDDPDHLYVINFNIAHNPYCAYNPTYSCAIPTREDRLPVAVRAGEMNYHPE